MFQKISKTVIASALSLSLVSASVFTIPVNTFATEAVNADVGGVFDPQIGDFHQVQEQTHDVVNVRAAEGATTTYTTEGGMIFRCEPGSTELSHNHEEVMVRWDNNRHTNTVVIDGHSYDIGSNGLSKDKWPQIISKAVAYYESVGNTEKAANYRDWLQESIAELNGTLDYTCYTRVEDIMALRQNGRIVELFYNSWEKGFDALDRLLAAANWSDLVRDCLKTHFGDWWYYIPDGKNPEDLTDEEVMDIMAKIKADAAKNKYIECDKLLYTWDPARKSGCEDPSTPLQVTNNEYRTGNFSSEYQLDQGIPSGKMYTNRTEASEWYGETNIRVRTVINKMYENADAEWQYHFSNSYYTTYRISYYRYPATAEYPDTTWTGEKRVLVGGEGDGNEVPEVSQVGEEGYQPNVTYITGVEDLGAKDPQQYRSPYMQHKGWDYDYNKEQSWWTGGGDNKLSLMGMVSYQYLEQCSIYDYSAANVHNDSANNGLIVHNSSNQTIVGIQTMENYEDLNFGNTVTSQKWWANTDNHVTFGAAPHEKDFLDGNEWTYITPDVCSACGLDYNQYVNSPHSIQEAEMKSREEFKNFKSQFLDEIYQNTTTKNDLLTVNSESFMDQATVEGLNFFTCDRQGLLTNKKIDKGNITTSTINLDVGDTLGIADWKSCDESSGYLLGYGTQYIPSTSHVHNVRGKSSYVISRSGSQFNSTTPLTESSTKETEIPKTVDNGLYATGIEVLYAPAIQRTRLSSYQLSSESDCTGTAGPDFGYTKDLTSGDHCLDGIDGKIMVHTPVISPVTIKEYDKTTGKLREVDTHNQLFTGGVSTSGITWLNKDGTNATSARNSSSNVMQLRLDGEYVLNWDFCSHRTIQSYGSAGGTGTPSYSTEEGIAWEASYDAEASKYDEFVEAKYVRFPFAVEYNGEFYDTHYVNESGGAGYSFNGYFTDWIKLAEPVSYQRPADLRRDRVTLKNDSSRYRYLMVSANHWKQTPFYIPSYAQEVDDGYIYYKVEAYNVNGMYDGNHTAEQDYLYNTSDSEVNYIYARYASDTEPDYVAWYRTPCQVSGHIYDFTITGTSDKDMFVNTIDNSRINVEHMPFCTYKLEKKVGNKNRLGESILRYRTDGEISLVWKLKNTLLLTFGKSESFNNMGALWKGTRFSFSLKTISNLWHNDDSIEIKPTFTYIDSNGNTYEMHQLKVYYNANSDNPQNLSGYQDMFIEYGSSQDKLNAQSVVLSNQEFNDSYYDEDDAYYHDDQGRKTTLLGYHFGDWVRYSASKVGKSVEAYMNTPAKCFDLSYISIPSSLRFLSGEWEELKTNLEEGTSFDGDKVVKYSDYARINDMVDSHGKAWVGSDTMQTFEGRTDTRENIFRDSMQTWYGQYYVPANLYIVVPEKHGSTVDDFDLYEYIYNKPDGITENDPIFEDGGYLIINFDIVAYKGNKPYLIYNGKNAGDKMWTTEGFDYDQLIDPQDPSVKPEHGLKPGDAVVIDLSHKTTDKYTSGIFNIN